MSSSRSYCILTTRWLCDLIGFPALLLTASCGLCLFEVYQLGSPSVLCKYDLPPTPTGLGCALWRADQFALGASVVNLLTPLLLVCMLYALAAAARFHRTPTILIHQATFQWTSQRSYELAATGVTVLICASDLIGGYIGYAAFFTIFAKLDRFQPWTRPILCFCLKYLPATFSGYGLFVVIARLRPIFRRHAPVIKKVLGHAVSPEQMPLLWKFVLSLAAQAALRPPAHILIAMQPSCFYSRLPVTAEDGVHEGGTLCCSLPLARLFDELEYASLLVSQLSLGQMALPWWQRFSIETKVAGKVAGAAPRYAWHAPAFAILRVWRQLWTPLEKEAGNQLLWAMLQPAAVITGRDRTMRSLVKTRVLEMNWGAFIHKVYEQLRNVRISAPDGTQLAARDYYANLPVRFSEATVEALRPTQPAISLFTDAEQFERQLSRTLCSRLVWE